MITIGFCFRQSLQYVLPSFFLLLITATPSATAAKPDIGRSQNNILVRDFKNYREIFYKDSRILISKTKKNINLVYTKNDLNLVLTQDKNKKVYELKRELAGLNQSVYYKLSTDNKRPVRQVGYYAKTRMKYFNEAATSQVCAAAYKPLLVQIGVKDICKKIGEFQITNLMDPVTCGPISSTKKADFENVLIDQFLVKSSEISKCFNKPEVQKVLEQDRFLQENAVAVFARFLILVDKISNGEKPLKIKCAMESNEKAKVASYNEKTNPAEISVSFKNDEIASGPLLTHELFHYGAQQYPLGKNQNCLDESFALLFDKICATADPAKEDIPSSAHVLSQCAESSDKVSDMIAGLSKDEISFDSKKGGDGVLATSESHASAAQIDMAQQQQIATNLQATTNPEVFVPVNPSDVTILANTSLQSKTGVSTTESYGEIKTVAATPEFEQALESVGSAFVRTATGMAESLNSAVAMTVSPAQAANGAARAGYSAQNSPYPLAQLVTEKYSASFDQPPAPPSRLVLALAATTAQALPGTSAAVAPEVAAATAKAVSATRQPASIAAPFATQAISTDPLLGKAQNNTQALAKLPVESLPQVQLDNATLQSLTAFNQMTGTQYAQVAKQYSDPAFEAQLKRRGISILVVNNKNKPIRKIGSIVNTKYSFVDNGKSLVKVEAKK